MKTLRLSLNKYLQVGTNELCMAVCFYIWQYSIYKVFSNTESFSFSSSSKSTLSPLLPFYVYLSLDRYNVGSKIKCGSKNYNGSRVLRVYFLLWEAQKPSLPFFFEKYIYFSTYFTELENDSELIHSVITHFLQLSNSMWNKMQGILFINSVSNIPSWMKMNRWNIYEK